MRWKSLNEELPPIGVKVCFWNKIKLEPEVGHREQDSFHYGGMIQRSTITFMDIFTHWAEIDGPDSRIKFFKPEELVQIAHDVGVAYNEGISTVQSPVLFKLGFEPGEEIVQEALADEKHLEMMAKAVLDAPCTCDQVRQSLSFKGQNMQWECPRHGKMMETL